MIMEDDMADAFEELVSRLTLNDEAEIPKPAEIDVPVDLFKPNPDDDMSMFKGYDDERQDSLPTLIDIVSPF
jgi:hypothetical protein